MLYRFVVAALLALSGASAFSAEPASGMWAIDGEINGKPGRGFQIDTQGGDRVIVSYFGYRTDGSALFLQASGARKTPARLGGDVDFEADLVEYGGGTVLGGPRQDGAVAASVGKVRMVFDSPVTGTVTLPGEPPKRMSRFQFEDHPARFNQDFNVVLTQGVIADMAVSGLQIRTRNGQVEMRSSSGCRYVGGYAPVGGGIAGSGTYACRDATTGSLREGMFRLPLLAVNAEGTLEGTMEIVQGNSVSKMGIYGVCKSPAVFIGQARCFPESAMTFFTAPDN